MSNDIEKVILTGASGFVGSYIAKELLEIGFHVVGIDNDEKYGPRTLDHESHENFTRINGDVRDSDVMELAIREHKPLFIILGAAKIGGIKYFHDFPYTLLAANERIMAGQYDGIIRAFTSETLDWELKKVVVISSSMVYEGHNDYSYEGDEDIIPPPTSSYGFQKLACERFARAAHDEYGVPYTIVRPFNCVGIGEERTLAEKGEIVAGNIAMSHVIPDLCQKLIRGQWPLQILGTGEQIRQYTAGEDLADGIVRAMLFGKHGEGYNLSNSDNTLTVVELATMLNDIHCEAACIEPRELEVEHVEPFEHDVQFRAAGNAKALSELHWSPEKDLNIMLNEVYDWVNQMIAEGRV